MNAIENRLYTFLKSHKGNFFEGGHDIHTPRELIEEMLGKIPDITEKSILVLFNVEFVISLVYTYKINSNSITFYSDHENKTKLAQRMGVHVITTLDTDMKFDNVIMNPPYTNGRVLLYAKFFEKALELADKVISVMPVDLSSKHDKLKFHNQRILKHQIFISDNVSGHFNVGYDNLYYVVASKSVENEVLAVSDPLDSMPLLYPEVPRLSTIKGDTDTAIGGECPTGVEAVFKIHKNDAVIYKKIEQHKYDKSTKKSKAPYLVFVNHTPSKGKFNCAVLENKLQTWSMWTFAFEADSLVEANSLKAWLQSPTIIKEVATMLKARNNQHTISKAMIERLPACDPNCIK